MLIQGGRKVAALYDEKYGVGIYMFDMGADFGDVEARFDWPAGLPIEIPVYPNGRISYASVSKYGNEFQIDIEGTTQSAYDVYLRKLEGLGWYAPDDDDPGYLLNDSIKWECNYSLYRDEATLQFCIQGQM